MMKLQEYEDFRAAKSKEEFREWFDQHAYFVVTIGGIRHPCVRITHKKVALKDGTLFLCGEENHFHRMEDMEMRQLEARAKMMEDYETLEYNDMFALEEYLRLLRKKSELMRAVKEAQINPDDSHICAFCGKTDKQVRRLIAGAAGILICDECVEICGEIIEEFEEETDI